MDENRIVRPLEDPLQNADILEHVFKNLSSKDLCKSRLVCKFWLESSANAMRSCTHVKIDCRWKASAMSEFLNVADTTKRIFSKAPDIGRYTLIGPTSYDENFWKFCGRIKFLYLDRVRFPSADAFRHAIFQSCPMLEELHLINVNVDGDLAQEPLEWVPPEFPQNTNLTHLTLMLNGGMSVSWMEIFSQFPSLQRLNVSQTHGTCDSIFCSLALCRQHNPNCWDLKILRINFSTVGNTRETAELIVQSKFSLDFLELLEISDPALIQTILSTQSTNLKRLTLSKSVNTPKEHDILRLPNKLFVNLSEFTLSRALLYSTRFLRLMPNLKRLRLSAVEPAFRQDEMDEDNWAINSCTRLDMHFNIFNIDELRRLRKRIPYAGKLTPLSRCNLHYVHGCGQCEEEEWKRIIGRRKRGWPFYSF